MQRKLKRYEVAVHFYIYAENDEQAKNLAEEYASTQDAKEDNKMRVYGILYHPQGSMDRRVVFGSQLTDYKL